MKSKCKVIQFKGKKETCTTLQLWRPDLSKWEEFGIEYFELEDGFINYETSDGRRICTNATVILEQRVAYEKKKEKRTKL